MLNLDAIEARAATATKGPWEVDHCANTAKEGGEYWGIEVQGQAKGMPSIVSVGIDRDYYTYESGIEYEPDAVFIAHARTDVVDLVARVRELEGEVGAKDAQLGKWIDEISAIRQLIRLRICPRNPDDDTPEQLKAAFAYVDLISERQNERTLKLERENGDLRRELAKHGIEVPR